MVALLLACLTPKPLTELLPISGLTNRSYFRLALIEPLVQRGLLALTLPYIPRSPNQRYRTTERGRALLGGEA